MFNVIQHFKNINKIYSLNFNFFFILKYITGLFQKKIINLKNISQIKEFRRLHHEGFYSFNWTTSNSHNFLHIKKFFKKNDDSRRINKLKILEIGSFEGYSANIFNKTFFEPEIYCVDPWMVYSEHRNINFDQIESNFDKNTKKLNVKKFKMLSSEFFRNNNKTFDLIYIDGSHKADDVFDDAIEAFKILNKNGLLFFDDFLGYLSFDNNQPIDGIAKFLNAINSNSLKLIFINSQICFLKE